MGRLRPRSRTGGMQQRRQAHMVPSPLSIPQHPAQQHMVMPPPPTTSSPTGGAPVLPPPHSCTSPAQVTFPSKLVEMLNNEGAEVIRWSEHGLSFFVQETDYFVNEILPKYFRHSKLTSFQRQLNLYGFRRISKGADTGAYFHPHFRRDRPELVRTMKRLPGQGATATAKYLPLYYSGEIAYKDVSVLDERRAALGSASPTTTNGDESGGSDSETGSECGDQPGMTGTASTPNSPAPENATTTSSSSGQAPPMPVPGPEGYPPYPPYPYPWGAPYFDPSYYHHYYQAHFHHHRPPYPYPFPPYPYPPGTNAPMHPGVPPTKGSTNPTTAPDTKSPMPAVSYTLAQVPPPATPVVPPSLTQTQPQAQEQASTEQQSVTAAGDRLKSNRVSSVCSDMWKMGVKEEEAESSPVTGEEDHHGLGDLKDFDMDHIFQDLGDAEMADLFDPDLGMDILTLGDEEGPLGSGLLVDNNLAPMPNSSWSSHAQPQAVV